jgi:mediator of RNA polymerase II transcription subunit 23
MVCETIMACDKLQYQKEDFWVECFQLIRRIIGGVDYKVGTFYTMFNFVRVN